MQGARVEGKNHLTEEGNKGVSEKYLCTERGYVMKAYFREQEWKNLFISSPVFWFFLHMHDRIHPTGPLTAAGIMQKSWTPSG